MEEVALMFPRSEDRNKLRGLFVLGMEAVELDGIVLRPAAYQVTTMPSYYNGPAVLPSEQGLYYKIELSSRKTVPKLIGDTHRISDWLLALESPNACSRLVGIMGELGRSQEESHNTHMLAFSLDNQQKDSRSNQTTTMVMRSFTSKPSFWVIGTSFFCLF
jgi:hypothetical protein